MRLRFNQACYFWGALDLFYLIRFVWLNASQGRIPFFADIVSFRELLCQLEPHPLFIFSFAFSLLLNISIILSAILLLTRQRQVRWLIYAQTPLRLLFFVPSLSVLPPLMNAFSVHNAALFLGLVILSEILKVMSFLLCGKNR